MTIRFTTAAAFFALATAPALAQTAWDMPTPYGDSVFHTQNIMAFADDVRDGHRRQRRYYRAFRRVALRAWPDQGFGAPWAWRRLAKS